MQTDRPKVRTDRLKVRISTPTASRLQVVAANFTASAELIRQGLIDLSTLGPMCLWYLQQFFAAFSNLKIATFQQQEGSHEASETASPGIAKAAPLKDTRNGTPGRRMRQQQQAAPSVKREAGELPAFFMAAVEQTGVTRIEEQADAESNDQESRGRAFQGEGRVAARCAAGAGRL
jgi:hypothetical protein